MERLTERPEEVSADCVHAGIVVAIERLCDPADRGITGGCGISAALPAALVLSPGDELAEGIAELSALGVACLRGVLERLAGGADVRSGLAGNADAGLHREPGELAESSRRGGLHPSVQPRRVVRGLDLVLRQRQVALSAERSARLNALLGGSCILADEVLIRAGGLRYCRGITLQQHVPVVCRGLPRFGDSLVDEPCAERHLLLLEVELLLRELVRGAVALLALGRPGYGPACADCQWNYLRHGSHPPDRLNWTRFQGFHGRKQEALQLQ